MFGLGLPEMIVILVLCVLVFGPNAMSRFGRDMGQTVKELKKVKKEIEQDDDAS